MKKKKRLMKQKSGIINGTDPKNATSLIMVIGERAKRARHSQVCSIENRGYIYIYYI